MGMNLPIRRIIFSTFSKFINSKEYILNESEIKQIAGRAGRYKRFPTGYITCLLREKDRMYRLQEALETELDQKEVAMVGPDLEIYKQVNKALETNALPKLSLVEFLRLFNTMNFEYPFYCVNLKEMIEVTEMVERANDDRKTLSDTEIFGFSCAPVNLGLVEHVQYFVWIVNRFARQMPIENEEINVSSDNIDYLETSIKCVEMYQWLSRHFNDKYFSYNLNSLLNNKSEAIEKLNALLSEKIVKYCSSCGTKLDYQTRFTICDDCFDKRRFATRRSRRYNPNKDKKNSASSKKSGKFRSRAGKKEKQSYNEGKRSSNNNRRRKK
ncbi:MAG: hypothetical protein ACOCUH_02425, partial [Bacteriovoracia bacterium]